MQWSPGFVLNQVKHLGQCQMLFWASLDIVSSVWVWHTGQVTVQTVTTPFHAGLLILGLANIRPTDPTSATNKECIRRLHSLKGQKVLPGPLLD